MSAGLRPRPRWGSLQRSPRPPSQNKGDLLLREETRERCREERERNGAEGRGGKERERDGRIEKESRGPPCVSLNFP